MLLEIKNLTKLYPDGVPRYGVTILLYMISYYIIFSILGAVKFRKKEV